MAQVEPRPGQQLARRNTQRARAILGHGLSTGIPWVSGHYGISAHNEADSQVNLARHRSGRTTIQRPYTSATNRARLIADGRSAAKAMRDSDKCSKHFSYVLKGKTGTKRLVLMTRVKALATRFYRLKTTHASTGDYQEQFGH